MSDYTFACRLEMLQNILQYNEDDAEHIKARKWLARHSFVRPDRGWLARPITKLLGPTPALLMVFLDGKPARRVKTYKLLPLLVMLAAVGSLVAMVKLIPGIAVSPLSLTMSWLEALNTPTWATIAIITMLMFVFAVSVTGRSIPYNSIIGGKFADKLAAYEEMWFRSGCENWSFGRKVSSCVGFGLMHVGNFFYPISSLVVLAAVGGVFMGIYLRAFKRTGNHEVATAESAKFHGQYNRYALLYLVVAVALVLLT